MSARPDALTWARTEGLALATLAAIAVVMVFAEPVARLLAWRARRRL